MVIKVFPHKVVGFIILLTLIIIIIIIIDLKNITTSSRLTTYMWINNNLFNTYFFSFMIYDL